MCFVPQPQWTWSVVDAFAKSKQRVASNVTSHYKAHTPTHNTTTAPEHSAVQPEVMSLSADEIVSLVHLFYSPSLPTHPSFPPSLPPAFSIYTPLSTHTYRSTSSMKTTKSCGKNGGRSWYVFHVCSSLPPSLPPSLHSHPVPPSLPPLLFPNRSGKSVSSTVPPISLPRTAKGNFTCRSGR